MDKQERIAAEIKRLWLLFAGLSKKQKDTADGIVKRAAFMRVTLEDMEKDLDENGFVEEFTQSINTPPYDRERPVARLYNTMNKNYQSIMKQLTDLLPNEPPKKKDDGFEKFINE